MWNFSTHQKKKAKEDVKGTTRNYRADVDSVINTRNPKGREDLKSKAKTNEVESDNTDKKKKASEKKDSKGNRVEATDIESTKIVNEMNPKAKDHLNCIDNKDITDMDDIEDKMNTKEKRDLRLRKTKSGDDYCGGPSKRPEWMIKEIQDLHQYK